MDKKSKVWGNVKHYLFLVLALGGVGLLMFLYVNFIGSWLGDFSTKNDRFGRVVNIAETNMIDIQVFSESEIESYDKSSSVPEEIEKTGILQDVRTMIFENAQSGEVYVSDTTGNVCAMYKYDIEGDIFYIIYDKNSADAHMNGQFVYVIGDSIITASEDSLLF